MSFTIKLRRFHSSFLLSLIPIVLGLGLILVAPGCRCSQTPDVRALPMEFKVGSAPFVSSRYLEVETLTLQKADPETGDHWTAEIKQTEPRQAAWEFQSAPQSPGNVGLKDRRADGKFIQHLLDTAMTLRVVEGLENTDRTRLGLEPPLFALRWQTPAMEYELKIGQSRTENHRYAEASLRSRLDSSPRKESGLMVVQGALLQMLALIKDFETIRSRLIFNFEADDMDEVEVTGKMVPHSFYMQRHGDGWADRKKRPLSHSPEAWLTGLMHLRSLRFIDDPQEIARIQASLASSTSFQAVFRDRAGQPTVLKAKFLDQKLVATLSSRPEGAFHLFADSVRFFQTPGRTAFDEQPRLRPTKSVKKQSK